MSDEGIIIRQISGFYDVLSDENVIQCKARGIFRKEKIIPMVGDKVTIDRDEKIIISISNRKNQFKRPLVSNIEHLGIVIAAKDPVPDHLLIDKLIVSALINNITPSLVINKIDLAPKEESERFENEYKNTGYRIFKISCKEQTGINDLKEFYSDGIVCLAGQSGVGKSSLINLLCSDTSQQVGELSIRNATGKHTTTHAQIVPLPTGVMLIDTPGFSSIDVEDIAPQRLHYYYAEFDPYLGHCRFDDCMHDFEPKCVIKKAVSDGKVSSTRYERYVSILRSLKDKKERSFR